MDNQQLNSFANDYTHLQALLSTLAEAHSLADLLASLPRQLGQLIDYRECRLALRHPQQDSYCLLTLHQTARGFCPVEYHPLRQGPANEIFAQPQPYIFTRRDTSELHSTAELCLALQTKTELCGALLITTSFRTASNFNLTSLLLIAAQQLAYAISRLRPKTTARTNRQAIHDIHATLNALEEGVITSDTQGNVNYMNPAAEKITGWQLNESHGQPLVQILNLINESSGETLDASLLNAQACPISDNLLLIRRDSQQLPITYKMNCLKDETGNSIGKVYTLTDISKLRQKMQHIAYHASHDSLTGLINRREFEQRLQALLDNQTSNVMHSLCYIDLDRFKEINDSCGHVAGDELLKQISALLTSMGRNNDSVARLGGDEFALLLAGCPLHIAETIAERIRSEIEQYEFTWHEQSFRIGASIGVIAFDRHSGDLDTLLSRVDHACYSAKRQGRNCVYVTRQTQQASTDYDYIHKIRHALQQNQFCLYAQRVMPLLDRSNKSSYLEILLRLIDDNNNLLQPEEFIPVAERYNMMAEIDRWVIENTFMLNKSIGLDKHSKTIFTSINISAQTLSDENILAYIQDKTRQYKIDTSKYCFELNENAVLTNLVTARNFIFAVKKLGYKLCIDNFGSRLSSFSYLKNLPVDFIKIDSGLVKNINQCTISFTAIDAINRICHSMGIKTIAKSVETQDSLYKLTILKVDFAQGFSVDQPQPHNAQLVKQLDNVIKPKISAWK